MMYTELLKQHEAALQLLSVTLEQNKAYAEQFGYPSGKVCPHCLKEVFTTGSALDQLAAAEPGTGLAHDHCHMIVGLQAELEAARNAKPTLTLVQLPNAEQQPAEKENESASA
jgi:hypothetical protein